MQSDGKRKFLRLGRPSFLIAGALLVLTAQIPPLAQTAHSQEYSGSSANSVCSLSNSSPLLKLRASHSRSYNKIPNYNAPNATMRAVAHVDSWVSHASKQNTGQTKKWQSDVSYLQFPHAGINQVKEFPARIPMTGTKLASLSKIDTQICQTLERWQVPAASLAIVKNGKLAYSKAYGYSDLELKKAATPKSLFRLGSISKIFTSIATLQLVEQGRLKLDTPAIGLLNYPASSSSAIRARDTRQSQITVANLLTCTAGWDRVNNGDPMFMPLAKKAAEEYSPTLRPSPESIIKYQLDRPLDFDPGSRFSYSNLGYCILGQIIEKISACSYSDYVRERLLNPLGLNSLRPGKTRTLAQDEVCYYGYPGENLGPSVLPNIVADLPQEYGGDFYLEANTADCGWIGSTEDTALFVSAVFGEQKRYPLHPQTVRKMISCPSKQMWSGHDNYFAMGWEVDQPRFNCPIQVRKEGCLPGSTALVVHRPDGTTCAIAFNSRPQMSAAFQDEVQKLVEKALDSCKTF